MGHGVFLNLHHNLAKPLFHTLLLLVSSRLY